MKPQFDVPVSAAPGDTIDICVTGVSWSPVVVVLEDGSEPPKTARITITVGDDGSGCTSFDIPTDWTVNILVNEDNGQIPTASIALT